MDPFLFLVGVLTLLAGIVLLMSAFTFKESRWKGVGVFLLGPFPIVIGSRRFLFLLAPALILLLVILLVL